MVKHLKQFVGNLPTNCLSVFDHFVGLALKGLSIGIYMGQSMFGVSLFLNSTIEKKLFRAA